MTSAPGGSLAGATEAFGSPPFAERARTDLGVTMDVGIGMGRTAVEAEAHARAALVRAQSRAGTPGIAPGREGYMQVPAPRLPEAGARRARGLETLSRLAEKLAATDAGFAVDAETAGRMLAVTPRTARRVPHLPVPEGPPPPLPATPEPHPRPPPPVS